MVGDFEGKLIDDYVSIVSKTQDLKEVEAFLTVTKLLAGVVKHAGGYISLPKSFVVDVTKLNFEYDERGNLELTYGRPILARKSTLS